MTVLEFRRKEKPNLKEDKSKIPVKPALGCQAIGIDLGTTNSVVSIFHPERNKPMTLEYEGSYLVPSLLYYHSEKRQIFVGQQAKKYLDCDPKNVIKSTKKEMGKTKSIFESNGKHHTAEEAAEHFLRYLISHEQIQQEKEKMGHVWAVITVPAHFDDAARSATISAAEKAGIFVLRIINEPTAAALAYSLTSDPQKTDETLVVFDFGGGTFDVTVVDRKGFNFQVLSSEGDIHLGGDDIDENVCQFLLKKVVPPFAARNAGKNTALYRKTLLHAEQIKKALQIDGQARAFDEQLDDHGSKLDVLVTRDEFDEMISSILQKTIVLTESAIRMARRNVSDVSRILLVGGSSRLALVRKMLADYFQCSVDGRLEPDLAISWGACLQSAMILGISVETILVDVCNYSLGVVVTDPFEKDVFKTAPILHKNTALPATKSEFFTTVHDGQKAIDVIVVQGESEMASENQLIGSFLFPLVAPCPEGTKCEIQLTYDVNGMVHVCAKQVGTENQAKAEFDSRTGKVVGWSFDTKIQAIEQPALSSEEDNISVVNAIVMKVKRRLKAMESDSQLHQKTEQMLKKYMKLLSEAQKGIENDDQIDAVELQLEELLKGFDE